VIGDTVNLASRLEGVNKVYGTTILISEDTYRLAQSAIEAREIDFITVAGKTEPIRVFELLEQLETEGATDLREVFTQFASRTRQQGLAVVISDFLDPEGFERGLKLLASMGHDVFVVHIASAKDRDPGALGDVRFVDSETGELRDVDVTPGLAAAYGGAWRAHQADLERFCGRYNLGYVRADAEQPFEQIILTTFRKGRFLS